MNNSRRIRIEKALLLLWFFANLVIGLLTVHEYGMSVDEPNNFQYAADTLNAYPSLFGTRYEPAYNRTFDGHGPAFITIASVVVKIMQQLFPDIFTPDVWHFCYFITFLLTGLCLYWLTKRWFSQWTAWGILILFSTQPLLLGHAFINPKDIPFMFLFTLSVVTGFHLVDNVKAEESFVSVEGPVHILAGKFRTADSQRKKRFLVSIALILGFSLSLFIFAPQFNSLIGQIVTFLYNAKPDSWAGRIFDSVASHSSNIAAEDYVFKALRVFRWLKRLALIAGLFFSISYFALLINNRSLSAFLHTIWNQRLTLSARIKRWTRSLQGFLDLKSLKNWLAEILQALLNPRVLLAGIALGLAAAVRAIGPWAGVIGFLYLLTKVRSRAWTTGIAYLLVTGIVTYIAWPRLWGAPIQRYLEGLGILANFPNYPGRVLFDGRWYDSGSLPRSYLPVLLNIQFTEPLLLGVYVGLGILGWQLLHRRLRTDLLLYIGLGFALPLFGLILLDSPLYHNFRQTLFLVPAMFLLAAPALELVFSKMVQNWIRILLIVVIALPGVISTVKLYPYEYVYYNSLVGGPAGALSRYELDYWRISLREMALELNEAARPGALIVVTRSAGLFARYTRPDLVVDKPINSILDLNHGYDYIVQVTRGGIGPMYREIGNLVVIERDGAVLATGKDVKNVSIK